MRIRDDGLYDTFNEILDLIEDFGLYDHLSESDKTMFEIELEKIIDKFIPIEEEGSP